MVVFTVRPHVSITILSYSLCRRFSYILLHWLSDTRAEQYQIRPQVKTARQGDETHRAADPLGADLLEASLLQPQLALTS